MRRLERAKKAAAKKKRKQERAKRKKLEQQQQAVAAGGASASSSSGPADASQAAEAAALDALEATFPAHPMHAYFSDAANGTQLRFSRTKGRHVVATRPLPAGEAVFRMAPYAAVVNDKFVHAFCCRCFQTGPKMLCCSTCQQRFCSVACKDAMARVHNLECEALGCMKALPLESESAALRMLLRICYMQQQEAAAKAKKTKDPKYKSPVAPIGDAGLSWADMKSLISHSASHSSEFKSQVLIVINSFQIKVLQDDAIWRSAELDMTTCLNIILQIQCNAHTITDASKNRVGLGLYIPAAYLNHSCRPNCVYWFDESGNMVMQSIRPIGVGEEVTYAYIDLYQSRASRAALLKQIYFIDNCQCERCLKTQEKASDDALTRTMTCSACGPNPLLALKSPESAPVGAKLPVLKYDKSSVNMHCSSCAKVYKKDDIDELISNTQRLADQAMLMAQSGDFDDAIAYFESRVLFTTKPSSSSHPFFHPYHASIFNCYLRVLSILQAAPQTAATLVLIVRYASAVLECLASQRLDDHPEAADTIIAKATALLALHKLQQGEGGQSIVVREPTRLVRKDVPAAAASAEAGVASLALDAAPTPAIHLLSAAYNAFARARAIRTTCFGQSHPLTRAASREVDLLQDAYDRHAGAGVYARDFDNRAGSAAAVNKKKKKK